MLSKKAVKKMATSKEYIEFIFENVCGLFENVRYKKMFGEYMVYVDEKPVLLVCDNTVFVKKLPELLPLMEKAECAFPYDGAKEHYVLDIENAALVSAVVTELLKVTPVPKRKAKKCSPDNE